MRGNENECNENNLCKKFNYINENNYLQHFVFLFCTEYVYQPNHGSCIVNEYNATKKNMNKKNNENNEEKKRSKTMLVQNKLC